MWTERGVRIVPIDLDRWNNKFKCSCIDVNVETLERGFVVLGGGSQACGHL